jgi:hypothetical protein
MLFGLTELPLFVSSCLGAMVFLAIELSVCFMMFPILGKMFSFSSFSICA